MLPLGAFQGENSPISAVPCHVRHTQTIKSVLVEPLPLQAGVLVRSNEMILS